MTCRTPISGEGRESRTGYSGTIELRRARHVSCCVHQDTLLQKPEQTNHVFSQSQDNVLRLTVFSAEGRGYKPGCQHLSKLQASGTNSRY